VPAAQAADERARSSVSATARADQWAEFCSEYTPECEPGRLMRAIVLTTKAWKDLARINKWVNDTVKPITDLEHWGVSSVGTIPMTVTATAGYVLLKRRMLMQSAGRASAADHRRARQARRWARRAAVKTDKGSSSSTTSTRTSCSGRTPATA
jgi:predicted transglutaminase-like cysteine proteinase